MKCMIIVKLLPRTYAGDQTNFTLGCKAMCRMIQPCYISTKNIRRFQKNTGTNSETTPQLKWLLYA